MKNLLKSKKTEGFTIIEVMIVLAIAGLIMVIVFIAVPQLQRNQRDNARQNSANRIESEMETFAGNNQGVYPVDGGANGTNLPAAGATKAAEFMTNYFNAANFKKNNPKDGNPYVPRYLAPGTDPSADQVGVYRDATCSGEHAATITGGNNASTATRQIALEVQLDNGSTYYCVDNG
jgi:prepilin-type N-terminal cleavage/methylation domain-containing protein